MGRLRELEKGKRFHPGYFFCYSCFLLQKDVRLWAWQLTVGALVAQWIEHQFPELGVEGSNPFEGTK